jgi:type IV pilus assembly protein PilW
MNPMNSHPKASPRGVTLIELMVGMLIGLLAILIISQVLLVSEGQKRTTTGGADAQVNGALSLYTVQRDIQMAGYGFTSSTGVIGCPISARYNNAAIAGFAATLAPVAITTQASRPAGSIGDSIRVLASSKTSYTVPTRVIPPGYAVNGQSFPVAASMGFVQGDLGLAAIDATLPCWVFQVTSAPTATSVPRADDQAHWNAAGTPTQAYVDGNILVNLGSLIDNRYEINVVNGVPTLQLTSFVAGTPPTWVTHDIQSDIVGLQAYYGRDTSVAPDGTVDVYDTTAPATNADWLRVLSIRLLVVSRSGQYEKDIVTSANPTWDVGSTPPTTGATACGASQCVTFDVGAGAAGDVDAKHYRYKVFETIVPLRNMLWSS